MLDFDKLDKAIHEKGRLAIMTLLATRLRWSFQDLKTELGMSDGNLVTHLRTLAQTWPGRANQGSEKSAANELRPDRQRAGGVQGIYAGAGRDRESGKRERVKYFLPKSFATQSKR